MTQDTILDSLRFAIKPVLLYCSLVLPPAAVAQEPEAILANEVVPSASQPLASLSTPPVDQLSLLLEELNADLKTSKLSPNTKAALEELFTLANCRASDPEEQTVQILALVGAFRLVYPNSTPEDSLKSIERAVAARYLTADPPLSTPSVSEALQLSPKIILILNTVLKHCALDVQDSDQSIKDVLNQDLNDSNDTVGRTAKAALSRMVDRESSEGKSTAEQVGIQHIAEELSTATTITSLAQRFDTIISAQANAATYRSYNKIRAADWFKQLPEARQASLLEAAYLLVEKGAEFYPLGVLDRAIEYSQNALYVNEGGRIAEFLKIDLAPKALAAFIVYLEALHTRGEPHTLITVQPGQMTVIGALCELAKMQNTGVDPSETVEAFCIQLIDPVSAKQGSAGTCGVMGVLAMMSVQKPAAVAGLFINACGRVGYRLTDNNGQSYADEAVPVSDFDRSNWEAILQDELMHRVAKIEGGTYKPDIDITQNSSRALSTITYGVYFNNAAIILTEELGIPFITVSQDHATEEYMTHLLTANSPISLAQIRWYQSGNFLASFEQHCIMVLTVNDGHVTFYNSQGAPSPEEFVESQPKGTQTFVNGPPSQYLGSNIYTTPTVEFSAPLEAIVVPDPSATPEQQQQARGLRSSVQGALRAAANLRPLLSP